MRLVVVLRGVLLSAYFWIWDRDLACEKSNVLRNAEIEVCI